MDKRAAQLRCQKHPLSRAAWRCAKCGRNLCPDCAAAERVQGNVFVHCMTCGGTATVLMAPKSVAPILHAFPLFARSAATVGGITQFVAVALAMYLLSRLPLIGGGLAAAVFVGYLFRIITRVARGKEGLPDMTDFHDLYDDLLLPLVRFVVATMILWAPALVYGLRSLARGGAKFSPAALLADPTLWLIIALGVLYFPAALVTAATNRSTLSMLNPVRIAMIILRIPGDYFLATALWVVLAGADLIVTAAAGAIDGVLDIPFVAPIVIRTIGLILPALTAFMFGILIHRNAVALGHLREEDSVEPAYPGAQPRNRWVKPLDLPDEPARFDENGEPVPPPDPRTMELEPLAGHPDDKRRL